MSFSSQIMETTPLCRQLLVPKKNLGEMEGEYHENIHLLREFSPDKLHSEA